MVFKNVHFSEVSGPINDDTIIIDRYIVYQDIYSWDGKVPGFLGEKSGSQEMAFGNVDL